MVNQTQHGTVRRRGICSICGQTKWIYGEKARCAACIVEGMKSA